MNTQNDIASVEHAGAAYAESLDKLREAIKRLAECLATSFGGNAHLDKGIILPWNYLFQYWNRREYRFTKRDDSNNLIFGLASHREEREAFLLFAEDVKSGWIKELATFIARHATAFEDAAKEIGTITNLRLKTEPRIFPTHK